jgi:hypothetical protein
MIMKITVVDSNLLFLNYFSNNAGYMRSILVIMFIVQINNANLKAQDSTKVLTQSLTQNENNVPELRSEIKSLAFMNSELPDTTIEAAKPKLLPDKMSFFERGMWGENGFMRWSGIASPLTPEVRKYELGVRRTMLTAHQIGGFATLGLMWATCYYGQRIIDGGVQGRRNLQSTKNTLVAATITSYSLTALLSIFSPPPLIRRDETSTTSIHKFLAWFHVAGMIITPLLGKVINTNRAFHMDKAHYHQVAGYITTAIFTTAMIVITL